jgi:DNA-binding transcriptional regulator YiaG
MTSGHAGRRSLYDSRREWHRVHAMTALRDLRRAVDLSQSEFAALMGVPTNTFRMWDSGLRLIPPQMLQRAKGAATEHARNSELLSLDQLARELGVHQRTLRAAARMGRLQVTFSIQSVFGRPLRLATRAAGWAFMRTHYRHYGRRPGPVVAPLPSVPHDYDARLKSLRHRLRLTQADLARRVGAANRAVVYQWESRKRTPSPVFWIRVEALARAKVGRRSGRPSSSVSATVVPTFSSPCDVSENMS